MGRRKANVVTLEVPEEPIEETPVETPMEEHHASVASETTEETPLPAESAECDGDPVDAQHQADLDRAAEAAVEAMQILGQIEEATRNVDNAAMLMEQAKKALKFRKEVYEDHVENLKRLCRMRMEKHPLFDGPANDQNDGTGEPDAGEGELSPDKDAWKELPLSDLGLPARLIGNLEEADITTIGELCDNMNADPLSWHEDITGVGPAAIGTIADKFIDFWRDHPEYGDDGEIDAEYEVDEDEDESNEDDE